VRVVEWGSWIWMTLSDQAPELLAYLGEIGEELSGYGLDRYTTVYRQTAVLKANWKIVVDAFNETWHVPFTHPETLGGVVLWRRRSSGSPPALVDDAAGARPQRPGEVRRPPSQPHLPLPGVPQHDLQLLPDPPADVVGVARVVRRDGAVRLPAQRADSDGMTDAKWAQRTERDWNQFLEVLDEDSGVINDFAKVIGSKGFRRNMFNTAESRLTAFHEEIAARLR